DMRLSGEWSSEVCSLDLRGSVFWGTRITHGLAIPPKNRATILIGTRPRRKLNLSGTAPELGIRWCHDDTNFIHEIRADECLRKEDRKSIEKGREMEARVE